MRNKKYNLILDTDGYKIGGHYNMYPDELEYINSYFECRASAIWDENVFFGLQPILEQISGSIVTMEDVDEAFTVSKAYFGNVEAFNYDGWQYIAQELGGKLPVEIFAIKEGSVVQKGNCLIQIRNTDPKCAWVVGYLETLLSRIWYPITVATKSREVKKIISAYWDATSDQGGISPGVDYCLHDFGARSASCYEASEIGGMAHLVNFKGTDTVAAIRAAKDYYNADPKDLAATVPASEHSIMTINGREGEEEIFKMLLDKYPHGILSVVDDSYDDNQFTTIFAEKYKEQILARMGKVVFRPDSGDPVECTLRQLNNLEAVFGCTTNELGYKILNPAVGILWGDGIDIDGIEGILASMKNANWSAENIVFGMGGALLQKVNRDNLACAFKACARKYMGGQWMDVFKEPAANAENGYFSKKSKRGRLMVTKVWGQFTTMRKQKLDYVEDQLKLVFENGLVIDDGNFADIRERAKI